MAIRVNKLLLAFLLITMSGLGLVGCTAQDTPRFALCMSHLSNDFTNVLAGAARSRADELGVELVVMDAQQDVSRQAGQISSLLRDGIDGLVVEPTSATGLESVLAKAMASGIPVVLVTQKVESALLYDSFVGTDAIDCGRLEMTSCVNRLASGGNIAILRGPVGSQVAQARYEGYLEILADQPQLLITAELNADWNETRAEEIVTNWIAAGKQMNAIVAQNDEMAIGAIKALQNTGKSGEIFVFGIDASSQALDAIEKGTMAATVSQQATLQGSKALEVCMGLSRGEAYPADIFVSQLVISAQNIHTVQN